MAKDLPYFKFVVSEWMVGDITGCSLSAQGLFINLCAFYWSKGGDLTLEKLNRKYPRHKKQLTELLDEGILKISSGKVEVKFLDEQLQERGHVSSKNSENAKSRWNGGKSDATALPTHESGNAKSCNIELEKKREELEERREENKREEENIEKKNIVADKSATLEQRAADFMERVAAFVNDYDKSLLREFYDYWTEKNEGGRKMRFEMEKVFDVGRRLKTWAKNDKQKNGTSKNDRSNFLNNELTLIANHAAKAS
jgi:hypothetical protein